MRRYWLYGCLTAVIPAVTLAGTVADPAWAQGNGAEKADKPEKAEDAPRAPSPHDHASEDVAPPVRIRDVEAVYPTAELKSGKDVLVVLAVTVDASGHVSK